MDQRQLPVQEQLLSTYYRSQSAAVPAASVVGTDFLTSYTLTKHGPHNPSFLVRIF